MPKKQIQLVKRLKWGTHSSVKWFRNHAAEYIYVERERERERERDADDMMNNSWHSKRNLVSLFWLIMPLLFILSLSDDQIPTDKSWKRVVLCTLMLLFVGKLINIHFSFHKIFFLGPKLLYFIICLSTLKHCSLDVVHLMIHLQILLNKFYNLMC